LGEAVTHYERALQCGLPPATAETAHGVTAFILFTQNNLQAAKGHASIPFGEPAWDAIERVAAANQVKDRVGDFCRWLDSNGYLTDSVRARLGLQPQEGKAFVASLIDSARALREAGNLADSIVKIEQAIALAPRQPGLHYELGAIYAMAGNHVQAARAYVAELSVAPTHAPSAHDIGVLYAQEGEYGEAASWLELALTLDPNNATTQRHLAEVREKVVAAA
jgi:tetratricopeptide (TPR) repeat protein